MPGTDRRRRIQVPIIDERGGLLMLVNTYLITVKQFLAIFQTNSSVFSASEEVLKYITRCCYLQQLPSPACDLLHDKNSVKPSNKHSGELQDFTTKLIDRAGTYGMKVSNKKIKVVISSTEHITVDITMTGQKLKQVDTFKYVGSLLTKNGQCNRQIQAE